ncbi:energy transducer TonB [Aquabacterium sp. OR-4]|uniref:energy transducer TonB n=1 Tax=Aquabacterium sp. OR-4 TaxID=2978127 RepID=UPI0021B2B53A|nr:energy transducer TonB [Aquabacterium sp. OR-4]MDT7834292.1 energy transducer TonB [Aquabacterium sp. OR-4]
MNSPALPLPSGQMLGSRRSDARRNAAPAGAPPRPPEAHSRADAAGSRLGMTPYQGSTQRPLGLVVVALHVAALWGLTQMAPVRQALLKVAPVVVSLVEAPATTPAAPPPMPAPPKPARPEPMPLMPPPPVVIQTAPPAPAPPPVLPSVQPAVAAAPTTAAVTATAAAPAAVAVANVAPAPTGPRMLPSAAVQYLVAPVVEYPRASRRLQETGRVIVRVLISETGMPERLSIERSSGHPRLDEAALAAVRQARFRPYVENGQAQSGWAQVPVSFELDP